VSERVRRIVTARVHDPGAITEAAAKRARAKSVFGDHGRAMIIAAERPGVTGVLGTADIKSITIAAGLGRRSAYTWLKLPVVDDMPRVLASSTLPMLLLGGEAADAEAAWRKALARPTVQGLVVGRSLLYPASGDVAGAVDRAVSLL
jgi:hypothetical protein